MTTPPWRTSRSSPPRRASGPRSARGRRWERAGRTRWRCRCSCTCATSPTSPSRTPSGRRWPGRSPPPCPQDCFLPDSPASPRRPRRRLADPDALAALLEAGLVEVGEQLAWNGHTATVRDGGVLHYGGPHEFAVSTVTALATSLAGYTVNGWHLWRRTRDDRPLSELRAALATH